MNDAIYSRVSSSCGNKNVAGSFNIHAHIPSSWFVFCLKISAAYIQIRAGTQLAVCTIGGTFVAWYMEEGEW